jgi:thiamine-phosphate pyrophosphorylase
MRLHAVVEDLASARAAAEGGATVVQLRRKGASTDALVEAGRGFGDLGATFVVNDDVEAALRLGADGVHLGRDDPGAERAVAAGLLLGTSAATVEEARAGEALGAAYVGAGPVWATPSKPDADPPLGLDGLAAICAAVSLPVVAIGGVDASNAGDCIRAGAAGVAVVRAARDAKAVLAAVDAAL